MTATGDEIQEEEFKVTQKQLNDAKVTFSLFDKKGNGTVPTKELNGVFKSLALHLDAEKLKDWADEADEEANGHITWEQFEPLYVRKMKLDDEEKEIREAFRVLDKTGCGTIPVAYVKEIMLELGERTGDTITKAEIDAMIAETDTDNSGTVDFEEFKALMIS